VRWIWFWFWFLARGEGETVVSGLLLLLAVLFLLRPPERRVDLLPSDDDADADADDADVDVDVDADDVIVDVKPIIVCLTILKLREEKKSDFSSKPPPLQQ
jgi:hypothetical protein